MRKKRRCFERKKLLEIEMLRHSKPKQFWRYFKRKKPKSETGIQLDDFYKYFSELSNDILQTKNVEAEEFVKNYDFEATGCFSEDLDKEITVSELLDAIKSLKREKATGIDFLLNEYFIECSDILASHICDIFNAILNSGYFPESWTEGVIVPLHKKGNTNDVNNYRGITLVSCFSKLFTVVLNKRITQFCEDNCILSDVQFGFRKERSTIDALFILTTVIQKYLNDNKNIYCAFIDLKKAYDSIYRNALWLKLYKHEINGKLLRIINDMYQKVKSCVRTCNNYSDFFEYAIGLRQGEILSPVMFSLFINDLEDFLKENNPDSGLDINTISLILLLFADDMAILAESQADLQKNLNLLYEYCSRWSLEVNTAKTKIMIFRKRGKVKENETFIYNGDRLEIVDQFTYLGTVFNYTGSFCLNQQMLVGKALKALNGLLANCRKFKLKPKLLCQLFDSFVGSILNYASSIWGFTKSNEIERIHLKFCKYILNVRKNTCNVAVYGELGRYPLYISRYVNMIKYWFKLLNTENKLLQCVYTLGHDDCVKGKINWVSQIKTLLCNYGFPEVWENPVNINASVFVNSFKQRVIDCFLQKWHSDKAQSSVLNLYNNVKLSCTYESYLDKTPFNLRSLICKFRVSSHNLRIHTGRYLHAVPRNERYCIFCKSGDLEDEYHFILICPCYFNLRKIYINKYYYNKPNMLKFVELLQCNNKNVLIRLGNFIKMASEIRTNLTHIM